MKKIISYLHLNKIGALELLFASYLILAGYMYGSIRFSLLIPLIMDVISIIQHRQYSRVVSYRALFVLFIFILVHEFLLIFFIPYVPSYLINTVIFYVVIFVSIWIISPALRWNKLIGALNLVAIISIIGLIYHFILIGQGREISPIKVPFLPAMESTSRLYESGGRPVSFFWEPQAYCSFMMIPLFLAIIERKFLWASIIVISMFASTSTTGIVLSLFMITLLVFSEKAQLRTKIIVLMLSCGLTYFLLNSSLFEGGVDKMESTNIEKTARIVNGPLLLLNMPVEHILFGIPAANVNDYYFSTQASYSLMEEYTNSGDAFVFISTFWLIIAKFGIIGILLYINLYIQVIKKNKELIIYVVPLFLTCFTNSDFFSGAFFFEFTFIYAFLYSSVSLSPIK